MPSIDKKKLFELAFRLGGAGSRPVAISIAILYMPGVSKIYFMMVYLSPLVFKISSLSDLVQYRRLITSSEKFEESTPLYYFVVLSRILIVILLLLPISVITGHFKIWVALSLYCVSDSYLMFNEIRYLLSGDTVRSAFHLVASRLLQVAALLLTFLLVTDAVFFSLSYLALVALFASYIYMGSTDVKVDYKKVVRYIRKKNKVRRYLAQLRKASVEIFSLVFFVMTPTLISLSQDFSDVSKYYVIGFSVCSFVVIFFRVLFFNNRIKRYIHSGLDSGYLLSCGVFSLSILLTLVAAIPLLKSTFDVSQFDILLAIVTLSGFLLLQLINQVLVFYLSARSVGGIFTITSSMCVLLMMAFFYMLLDYSYYLQISVILPALVSISLNYFFYRKAGNAKLMTT